MKNKTKADIWLLIGSIGFFFGILGFNNSIKEQFPYYSIIAFLGIALAIVGLARYSMYQMIR